MGRARVPLALATAQGVIGRALGSRYPVVAAHLLVGAAGVVVLSLEDVAMLVLGTLVALGIG